MDNPTEHNLSIAKCSKTGDKSWDHYGREILKDIKQKRLDTKVANDHDRKIYEAAIEHRANTLDSLRIDLNDTNVNGDEEDPEDEPDFLMTFKSSKQSWDRLENVVIGDYDGSLNAPKISICGPSASMDGPSASMYGPSASMGGPSASMGGFPSDVNDVAGAPQLGRGMRSKKKSHRSRLNT
eukprot:CAMPEP_0114334132 /NCGR_PEP_ID=MMETSP0101-20121206/4176_1 /TAXON_ID=38822 ORGANISM="Pteridomonas danica, Strain PT" /NCGR_SAMPLE_ID=MMETSP0101 /ASSEMBLY_ACC=CAM_ASM_000211 /LENGTH=181 /DNA_ID=CAMNT_0001465299 /DNA_START=338 /DNA_END=883 /DNA_ORIENTATION=-